MKLSTPPEVYLTDHQDGALRNRATGKSCLAGQAERKIAAFFQTPADWSAFPHASVPEMVLARDHLLSEGLLVCPDVEVSYGLQPADVTIFGVPARQLADVQEGEIVFLGAPFDLGTTAFPGCRFGPAALRVASTERFECQLDIETGRMHAWNVPSMGGAVLGGARLCDLGDLPYQAGAPIEGYYTRLRHIVDELYKRGAFPVILGGDHSITYSTVSHSAEALAHFDAHCDLAERVPGHSHHHGNVLGRLLDEGFEPEIHHFGLRETGGWDTVHAGTHVKAIGDLALPNWNEGISGKTVFVSLDVDVLDPSILPGTGTPVVGGLNLQQLCQMLAHIATHCRPVGLDVVELCPMRDGSGRSEHVVIEALICFLAMYFRTHESRRE